MSIKQLYRMVATAFCFALFGLGGLCVLLLVFPVLRILSLGRDRQQRSARVIIHFSFRLFCWVMTKMGVLTYEVHGKEKLRRNGQFIVANHPSLIDVVFLISMIENPVCVVKKDVWRNPFMVGAVHLCGFICNDIGVKLVEDCVNAVQKGNNLIIFPEGTRTRDIFLHNKTLNPLRRGTAQIVLRGNLTLTPVIITVSEPMLAKHKAWYQVPKTCPHFTISVLDDVAACRWLTPTRSQGRTVRKFTEELSSFLTQEVKRQWSR